MESEGNGYRDAGAFAERSAIVGDYAYVSALSYDLTEDPQFGFRVFDISDPRNPALILKLENHNQLGGLDLAIEGNKAYLVGDRLNKTETQDFCDLSLLRVVDIAEPSNPVIVGRIQFPNSMFKYVEAYDSFFGSWPKWCHISSAIATVGDYAYVVGSYGLAVVNISEPTEPAIAWLGYIKAQDKYYHHNSIAIAGSYAYISDFAEDHFCGLTVVNISDPSAPQVTGWVNARCLTAKVEIPSDVVANIAIVGDYAYLAVEENVELWNIADPTKPDYVDLLWTHSALGSQMGIAVLEDRPCFAFLDLGRTTLSGWSLSRLLALPR